MTFSMMATHDVFVGRPAAVDTARRVLQHCLPTSPFETSEDSGGGSAALGRHAVLYVGSHGFSDDAAVFSTGLPVKLQSDFPAWVSVRGFGDAFEEEAAARRVYQVLADQKWPVVLLRDVRDLLASAHCEQLGGAYPVTPVAEHD